MQKLILKRKISHRIEQGHPWVFANEINIEAKNSAHLEDIQPGEIVEVYDHADKFVGRGYANTKSKIIVRLLTRNIKETIDADFFYGKIQQAWEHRQHIGYIENCRLIFGEADDIPALVIDKFNDYFVIQTLAYGIDIWKPAIIDALNKIFKPKGIYERNDVPVRELEGMEQITGFLSEPFDTNIIINENGLKFHVDLVKGQKTGYFLDQQDNRRHIQHIVKGANVLEAFCYTGTFSAHAAFYGAKQVYGIDISETAVAQARRNAELNGLQNICTFEAMNAFDALKQWSKDGKQYDVVMIDPPAFTKSRENIQKAITGYKEINLRAIKLVKPGGYLVTASCTNLVQPPLFMDIIAMAAKDARRRLKQVTYQTQASDHPIVWGLENTEYLKFLIVQVL
ncbi:class I SAM-dependent rRNA methyltransferase [Polluticaenibacter yanchengensis]|uniref:Class I SAM-dependent rRNA methyltransferase n=1 Tax=Polluticaenibacter yanchengensis TaxID=3014562 RepID=A0ABT4UN79_9BACT|nr:class I SAM-dependent rRNA methyltransferase [Chitinophagaceae bacterium LY-5]